MAWRFVKQPDGKLARWSDVVESFTDYGMTREEAIDMAVDMCGRAEAEAKVQRGLDDEEPWRDGVKGDGLARWRDCIRLMPLNAPKTDTDATLTEIGFPEWIPKVDEWRAKFDAEREAERKAEAGKGVTK